MDYLAEVFKLPVSKYKIDSGRQWLSLDFGELKLFKLFKNMPKSLHGKFSMLINGNWQLRKDRIILADRRDESYDHIKDVPKILINTHLTGIKISEDQSIILTFSNGYEILAQDATGYKDHIFLSIRKPGIYAHDLLNIFRLPISKYQVLKPHKWIGIDFGKIAEFKTFVNDKEISKTKRGEYQMVTAGNWQIKKAKKIVADSKKMSFDKLKNIPDVLLGSLIKELTVSADCNKINFKLSNGYELVAEHAMPDPKDWVFMSIWMRYRAEE